MNRRLLGKRATRLLGRFLYGTPPATGKSARAEVPVTFRSAKRDHVRGVRTFYVSSLSDTGRRNDDYVLKVIRRAGQRRMTCTCRDYVHRAGPVRRHCKHLRLLCNVIATMGGVSQIPSGVSVTV